MGTKRGAGVVTGTGVGVVRVRIDKLAKGVGVAAGDLGVAVGDSEPWVGRGVLVALGSPVGVAVASPGTWRSQRSV